jgi:hypothetical protein
MRRVWGEYEESIGNTRETLGKGIGKTRETYGKGMGNVSDRYAKGIRCLGASRRTNYKLQTTNYELQ